MDFEFRCVDCDKLIADGEPMWSVNVNREVFEDGAITVLQADSYKVYCEECAQSLDFLGIHIPRKPLV